MLRERAGRRIHIREVGFPGLVIHEDGRDEHHCVRTRDRLGVVRRRAQTTGRDELGQTLLELGLTGEGLLCGVDGVDGLLIDIDTDHVVTRGGELDGEGKPDLSEGDDGDTHIFQSTSFRPHPVQGRLAFPSELLAHTPTSISPPSSRLPHSLGRTRG